MAVELKNATENGFRKGSAATLEEERQATCSSIRGELR
jgi:hypothetical protein